MSLIVLFGLFASTIAVLKAVSLYRLPIPVPALAERVQSAVARGGDAIKTLTEQVQGPQGELVRIAITAEAPSSPPSGKERARRQRCPSSATVQA